MAAGVCREPINGSVRVPIRIAPRMARNFLAVRGEDCITDFIQRRIFPIIFIQYDQYFRSPAFHYLYCGLAFRWWDSGYSGIALALRAGRRPNSLHSLFSTLSYYGRAALCSD